MAFWSWVLASHINVTLDISVCPLMYQRRPRPGPRRAVETADRHMTWPLSLVSGQEAVRAVYRGRATVVEEWSEVFRSPWSRSTFRKLSP
jgi:hypothetical protein